MALPPPPYQAIIRNFTDLPSIVPLETNFYETLISLQHFSYKKWISKCRLPNAGHLISASTYKHQFFNSKWMHIFDWLSACDQSIWSNTTLNPTQNYFRFSNDIQNSFSYVKTDICRSNSLKLVFSGPIYNGPALAQIMALCPTGNKHFFKMWWFSLLMHICHPASIW